jgi:putative ABC transport system permease protein
MWRNYLTVSLRSLAKNRTYAFINIFGLAIGLAACLMILLYVRYELSYDKWLPNSENVYQLQSHYTDRETGEVNKLQMTSYIAGTAFKKDFPQVDRTVYFQQSSPVLLRGGEALTTENVLFVGDRFLDVLQFPLVRGDPKSVLAQPGSLVLAEKEATRLFGSTDPVGKTVTLVSRGITTDYRVTGIAKDPPKNSHVEFTMIGRVDFPTYYSDTKEFLDSWGWQSGWFYFTLKPGTDAAELQKALPAWEKRNIPTQQFGQIKFNAGDQQDWKIENVRDVHLGEAQDGAMRSGNDRRSIATFAIIAVLILGMACINFTNLATARASQRAREVALRKVLGANRSQLIVQFLAESILVAAFAMLLALALVEFLLPPLSGFLDADLSVSYFGSEGLLLPILTLIIVVGAAGGIYPAFYLSGFQPAQVLKANKSSAEAAGSGRLRGALVIGQFAVSIGLIICTAVVYGQTVYARSVDPGYKRDGLIQVSAFGRRQMLPLAETMVREMKRVDGVVSVGRTGIGVATQNNSNTGVQVPGRAEPVTLGQYSVDTGFFETMGIKLVAGRSFEEGRPADDMTQPVGPDPEWERELAKRGVNVVVNELAVKRMGFGSPQDAIGKTVKAAFVSEEQGGLVPATIIGVVQDSRFRSVRQPIDPILFRFEKTFAGNLLIRYANANPATVMANAEAAWKRVAREVPFDGEFSESIIKELYEAEEARAKTFAGFALLAVIVACLGLFGLAAFTAERRTKEIGIRKVLGARSRDIVRLLTWQFSKPVIIANLIAWPVAWWLMRDWLNTFDDRITLGPTPFLLAGFLALAIAIGTIAGHALKVSRANPIQALRYE